MYVFFKIWTNSPSPECQDLTHIWYELWSNKPSEILVSKAVQFNFFNQKCYSTGSSYSIHQRQLCHDSALVTGSFKTSYLPLLSFRDKAHCLCACVRRTCILQIFLQNTNDNPLVLDMWDWTLTCMWLWLIQLCSLHSVFTDKIMYFFMTSHIFGKIKDYCLGCCIILTKYGDKKSVGSSFFGA